MFHRARAVTGHDTILPRRAGWRRIFALAALTLAACGSNTPAATTDVPAADVRDVATVDTAEAATPDVSPVDVITADTPDVIAVDAGTDVPVTDVPATDVITADVSDAAAGDSGLVNGCPSISPDAAVADDAGADTFDSFARGFFAQYCTRCHASALAEPARNGAPAGLDWDREAVVRMEIARIRHQVAVVNAMPISPPLPTCDERRRLARWIDTGAR